MSSNEMSTYSTVAVMHYDTAKMLLTLFKILHYFETYNIILLKSVCLCSQTVGHNSCSIVSGDVSNCSYCLTVHPVMSSLLSSA